MKVETVLPLGKLDPGLRDTVEPLDLDGFLEGARQVERIGYDRLTVTETRFDPFVQLALAAQATNHIEIASAVAIAFPRSPTVTAQAAWTLQKLSHGRLSLGLGTQVKGHIERRFGMNWAPPGPWLREYIQAVRAVWHAYQTGEQPAHDTTLLLEERGGEMQGVDLGVTEFQGELLSVLERLGGLLGELVEVQGASFRAFEHWTRGKVEAKLGGILNP